MGSCSSQPERGRQNGPLHSQKTKLRTSARVAIVGGGPAGIHMAAQLKKKGFTNVTILEKSNRISGKVNSVESNGVIHEMGACWLSTNYDYVRNLVQEYSVSGEEKSAGPTGSRDIMMNGQRHDISSWMYAEVEKTVLPPDLAAALPDKLQAYTVFKAFKQYIKLHRKLLGKYGFTMPPEPTPEIMRLINKPLLTFLKENHLTAAIPFLSIAQTAQGYGFLETVSAFYALYWLDPRLVQGYIDAKLHLGPAVPTLLTKGYENIFTTIQEKQQLNVRLNVNIARITRPDPSDATGPVRILLEGAEVEEEYDFVILAAPLPAIVHLFDASDEEKTIIGAMKPMIICTHLIHCNNPHDKVDQSVVSFPTGLSLTGQGHVYSIRNSRKAVHDLSGPGPNGKFTFVTYQLTEGDHSLSSEALTEIMHTDLASYGLTDIEVEQQNINTYFYHFDMEGLANRYPWRILELQGSRKTWYIGCSVSFESVNDLVSYNDMLIDRFLSVSVP